MATVIPGPQARANVNMVPGRYGAGTDSVRDFFLKMIPALQEEPVSAEIVKASGNFGRPKSDWTLSDMNEAVVQVMISNVEELLNQAREETWYFDICPRKENFNAMNVKINSVYFRPEIVQEAAPRTLPRTLDIEQTTSQVGLTRFISGFQVDSETLMSGVEKGMDWFLERIAMLEVGLIESDKFFIITGIMNAHKIQRLKWNELIDLARKRGNIRDWVMWENDMTFSLCKQDDPLRWLRDQSLADFSFLGVPTNNVATIMHEHAARALLGNKFYRNRSEGDMQEILDDRSAISRMLGQSVNFTRNFKGPAGQVLNPIGTITTLGLYYPLVDPHDQCPDRPYKTAHRAAKITNVDDQGMMVVQILEAFARSGRWNLETGELNSLVEPEVWAVASPDLQKRIGTNTISDAFHVYIGETAFSAPEEPGYLGPAKVWGSLKPSTVSTAKFQSCAQTVIANMGPGDAAIAEAAITTFMELVAQAGMQPLMVAGRPVESITRAIDAGGVSRPVGIRGCQPINPVLKFSPSDPNTGFMAPAASINTQVSVMPAGYGSLAAMRYLVRENRADAALTARLQKVLDGADLLAQKLKAAFGGSPMINPDYAASDMIYANAADMLFTSGLLPRRAVVILKLGAGGDARQAKETADGLYANANAYFRGTGHETVVTAYAPALGDAVDVLVKKSIMLTVLRSFAKDAASGRLLLDPGFLKDIAVNTGSTAIAFGEEILAMLGVHKKDGSYVRSSGDLRKAFATLQEAIAAAAGGGGISPVMTKLLLEPSQIAELAGNPTLMNLITVGRDGRQDVPATEDELKTYADAITGKGGSMPYFGVGLHLNQPLLGAQSIGAISAVGQIRQFMRENGYPLARKMGGTGLVSGTTARPSGGLSQISDRRAALLKKVRSAGQSEVQRAASSASAADPTGIARQYLGCIDADVDLIFNDHFATHWDEANALASTSLELLIMRLYMTTSTNYKQSIQPWATTNVRIPLHAALLRMARVRTNPVIRIVPGENTCFLASGFQRTLRGTDQSTGMFSLNHSYYSGFVPVQEKNIQVYNGVDPHGYLSGMGSGWADFSRGTPGMVAVVLPGNRLPIAISPFGNVGIEAIEGGDMAELETGTESIAIFEMMRQGRMRQPWMPEMHPNNPYGVPIAPVLFEHYSRDTTMLAGPDCDYTMHVASSSAIPTEFATNDLRRVLDGRALRPAVPLALQSNLQLPVSA